MSESSAIIRKPSPPRWFMIVCVTVLAYFAAGILICGNRILDTYPITCGNSDRNCTNANAAVLLWPVFLMKPELLKGVHFDGTDYRTFQ